MATGKELRLLRFGCDLTTVQLAAEMGISRTTLWSMERAATVRPEQANAYRAAVARLMAKVSDAPA